MLKLCVRLCQSVNESEVAAMTVAKMEMKVARVEMNRFDRRSSEVADDILPS